MTNEMVIQAAVALNTLVALATLAILIYGPGQTVVVDGVRQRLFELRDSMFDLAVAGEIAFDDPLYRYARDQLNSLIRFTHRATIWRILLVAPVVGKLPAPKLPEVGPRTSQRGMEGISWALRRAEHLMVACIWLRSPLFIVLSLITLIPIVWALLLSDAFKRASAMLYSRLYLVVATESVAEERPHRWHDRSDLGAAA